MIEVSQRVAYSHARRRAVRGLAVIASEHHDIPGPLREALWDCEDEAAADACSFMPALDEAALARVRQLGVSVVVTKDGVPCVPCVDASGDDDETVAVTAGFALGRALAQMLAPGIDAVAAGARPRRACQRYHRCSLAWPDCCRGPDRGD